MIIYGLSDIIYLLSYGLPKKEEYTLEKKMIIVTSPPASGKTFVSKELSKRLKHVVYLDKDTLIPLSKQIFAVAGQPYDRSSRFFEDNIRNYEYDCIVALALEALDYDDIVLVNAPFSREIRDAAYIRNLRTKLSEKNSVLVPIWVETSPEVVRERMIKRNSDRDTWKLAHWDEYIAGCDFSVPELLDEPEGSLIRFKNNNNDEFETSMKSCLERLELK